MGRAAQPFDLADATKKVGAPLFAFCTKGGHDAGGLAQLFRINRTRGCPVLVALFATGRGF
jgi:hypothetical protein